MFTTRSLGLVLLCSSLAVAQPSFITDPGHPELRSVAGPLEIDESQYGCGPLLKPGRTYYVSLKGDDSADGLSWKTAWRHIRKSAPKLKPGDTLLIDEGEYREGSVPGKQSGEPGRPIRIMAAPRCRVIITNAIKTPRLEKTPGARNTFETPIPAGTMAKLRFRDIYEAGSFIQLEDAGRRQLVDELPGTFAYDPEAQKLYVSFSDGRPAGDRRIYWRRSVAGFASTGSYWLIKGIRFQVCQWGVKMQRGGHNTVEDCEFLSCSFQGINFGAGAHRMLIKNNYGRQNPFKGLIQFCSGRGVDDNLVIGNHSDGNAPTVRRARAVGWCIHDYSGGKGKRNYIINNIMNYVRSAKWKPPGLQTVFQGNVCTGAVYCTGSEKRLGKSDRMILRNNVIAGNVSWAGEKLGPGGAGGDWAAKDKVFVGNFWGGNDAKKIAAARFADPSWLDYRLQSDSPLRGKALGRGDRGAFYRPGPGRIFYVGPKGSDSATGTSSRAAFKTLGKSASALRAGDTLYVMQGEYAEPLVVRASGASGKPIRVRAHQRLRVRLPGVELSGSNICVEGFVIAGGKGDGVRVRGAGCEVNHCLVRGASGAGVGASGAKGLTLNHCTLVGARVGVSLEDRSTEATIRNCIIASNRAGGACFAGGSRDGYRGYNNCCFGEGVDAERVAREQDTVVADPVFINAAGHDYRLRWDSPAFYLGEFARAAGSEERVPRQAEAKNARVVGVQRKEAVVRWETPGCDTLCEVQYRRKGSRKWRSAPSGVQGTVHAAGLRKLSPNREYEFRIKARNIRGSEGTSATRSFRTRDRSRPAATFYVSNSGNDAADGLTPGAAWLTLRKACLEAQAGDTVLIAPGVYHDQISMVSSGKAGRPITFMRHGNGEVLLDDGGVDRMLVDIRRRDFITLDGITFAMKRRSLKGYSFSIWLEGCRDIAFLNCRNSADPKTRGASFLIKGCHGIRLERNVFWRVRYYIQAGESDRFIMRNNVFGAENTIGMMLWGWPKDSVIENNIFYNVRGYRNAYWWFNTESLQPLQCDYNLYLLPKNPKHGIGILRIMKGSIVVKFTNARTLKDWRRLTGFDMHSIQADPMFVDPEKGDYRLRPGSPAIGAGRDGVNMGAMGVAR